MEKDISKEKSKFNLPTKILAITIFVFLLLFHTVDRIIHLLLPHRTHPRLGEWNLDKQNRRFAFARIIIFTILIIILKNIF